MMSIAIRCYVFHLLDTSDVRRISRLTDNSLPSIKYFFSRVGWLWASDLSVPRKVTSGLPGWNFKYSAQASFSRPRFDLARLLRRAYSRSVWILSFEFVKVCGIRFSTWESFIGFYICCYLISTILACPFSVGVRILWKKLCWMRACGRKWHLMFPTLYIIIVDRVNLNKLLQIVTKLPWSNKDNNN